MVKSFEITAPLPARGSADALRQQLIEHLLRTRPNVGDRFLSDHELARISQLSRPTVRRALNDLEREGWIERRPGIGTFIGPRAAISVQAGPAAGTNGNGHGNHGSRQMVRLALMLHLVGDFGHDWYAGGVISGIDRAAEECGVALELVGDRQGDVKTISRRLMQSRPDVLAFCAPTLRHVGLMGEAKRLDIPVIGTGTLMANIGYPAVCEDGVDASKQAVGHFVANGHERIGLILAPFALPWVFARRQGYMDGLAEAGLEQDESLVHWLVGDDDETRSAHLMRFIEKQRPTALLFASWVHVMQAVAPLTRSGKLRIPQDVSVITYDQHPNLSMWLGGVEPTVMQMPLREMGQRLARMACDLAEGKDVEPVRMLPCELVQGDSVARRG